MSHEADYNQPDLKNLEFLKKAFENLGWIIRSNIGIRGGSGEVYPYVALNPDLKLGYDVGISVSKEGEVTLSANFDAGHGVETLCSAKSISTRQGPWGYNKVGWDWGKLKQEYQKVAFQHYAKHKHGTMHNRVLTDGSIELEIEVNA